MNFFLNLAVIIAMHLHIWSNQIEHKDEFTYNYKIKRLSRFYQSKYPGLWFYTVVLQDDTTGQTGWMLSKVFLYFLLSVWWQYLVFLTEILLEFICGLCGAKDGTWIFWMQSICSILLNFLSGPKSLCFVFLFVCGWATTGSTESLFLALCSGIISSEAWGTIWIYRNLKQVGYIQDKLPAHYIISPALMFSIIVTIFL